MNIKHLEVFQKIYRLKNMTKAAKELHMTQPACSFIIKQLEETYQIKLFDRIGQKLYPTQKADELYQISQKLFLQVEEMEHILTQQQANNKVVLGTTITIANKFLPSILQHLQNKLPNLNVECQIFNANTIEQMIQNNQIDLGLIETSSLQPYLVKQQIMEDCIVPVTSNHHPLTKQKSISIETLVQYPYGVREQGSSARYLIENIFQMHHVEFQPTYISSSTHALIELALKHNAIIFLPQLFVQEYLIQNQLCILDCKEITVNRSYHLVYHKNKYISPLLKQIIQEIETIFHNYE